MNKLISTAVCAASLVLPSTGIAQAAPRVRTTGVDQEITFQPTDVRGALSRDDLDAIRRARRLRGTSLIRLRETFMRETQRSVETE
jgi:hypothetical protein